ncbi:MAG TPA: response regulator [Usitatibacteraceae bacterium]|jgi:DNA-binding response OmpR family regulator|nr:response regulator [Usitatibacteraceae bacterium]
MAARIDTPPMEEKKTRLLVVDDDRIVLATLVAGLARAGFDVVVAANADEAMKLAVEVQPALALLDVEMEGKNGLDVAQFLSSETRVPFMFLSAHGEEAIVRQAAAYGALGFLVKPLDVKQMIPAIRSALERAHDISHLKQGAAMLADTLVQGRGRQALIAIGILVERHKVNCDQALEMLHQRARASGRSVEDVALLLIEQAESHARPGEAG